MESLVSYSSIAKSTVAEEVARLLDPSALVNDGQVQTFGATGADALESEDVRRCAEA